MTGRLIRFELAYHLRRVSTYVYFVVWFAISFLSMTLVEGSGRQLVDAPKVLAQSTAAFTAFGVIVISAICGMAVCRDFELNVYPLIFTRPIRRREYLTGRWIGSLLVCALVFISIPLGLLTGSWMPWVDRASRMPFQVWPYIQPYLLFTLTTCAAMGTLFFALGALTRRVSVVYLQGALCLAIFLLSDRLMPSNLNDYWPAVVDAFGMLSIQHATKYWTIVETNALTVPVAGVVLANRLLWCGVGLVAAVAVFRWFPFSTEAMARRRRSAGEAADQASVGTTLNLPVARPRFGPATSLRQFASLTRVRLRTIVTDLVFLAIAAMTVILQFGDAWGQPRVQDTPVYPVTYLMTRGTAMALAIVVTAIYAGELVWRERQIGYHQVHDALPLAAWTNFASQFAALAIVQAVLLASDVLTGVATQVSQGYYRFELDLYFTEIFVIQYSMLLIYAALALFVQTVSPSKFLGHVVVIAVFLAPEAILQPLANRLEITFPANLYAYGFTPPHTYSDMNGYGPFVRPLAWFTFYWSMWAALLVLSAVLLARRGTDAGWRVRLRQARGRTGLTTVALAGGFVVCILGSGGWIYYNARVLNEYVPSWEQNARRAGYERDFKTHETLPQPKVTAVDVRVEVYPSQGTFTVAGTMMLVNKSAGAIAAIHVTGSDELKNVSFDRPATRRVFDEDLDYAVYQLASPLGPGESILLKFDAELDYPGFHADGEPTRVVANGTFFNSDFMPIIGYEPRAELTSEGERRRQGLGERAERPPPDAAGARQTQHFFRDAVWVSYRAVIGTEPDQIAMTPGYLVREWTENGRRYFEYDLSDTRTHKFFSYLSGRYAVARDHWNGVAIEVYHHRVHTYNVERMIQAVKDGLEYFAGQFAPYQFRQFRVLEFPRYGGAGAQSYANTVSYSEGAGFISNPVAEDELDYPYYVTLHELAHQWWGHQLVGAATQGSNMLSESLAEYSALLVTEKTFGSGALRVYLKHDLDAYLRGRSGEQRREQTLARAEAGYVLYRKGSLAMYALKDYLGVDVVNGALRGLLDRYRLADPPYPTTDDLVAALRAVTPGDLQYLITDLFETITLYDNRALEATWQRREDGKYVVTLKVQSAKLRADGEGRETPTPMDDLIDIGVFAGRGKQERALYLEKHRLTGGETALEIVVDEPPTRAGVDPYNKLIDRLSGDNVVAVGAR